LANTDKDGTIRDDDDGPDQVQPSDVTETSSRRSDEASSITTGSSSSGPDVQALLASALNLTQDNHVLRDAIADAINAASL
jgi:hypothetical protein